MYGSSPNLGSHSVVALLHLLSLRGVTGNYARHITYIAPM
jgi:hypothetical protein